MLHIRKHQLVFEKQPLQQKIIVPTNTILHPSLEAIIIRYAQDAPKKLCSRNKAKKTIQRHPIIVTDDDYDSIMDKIDRCEKLSLKGM